MSLLDHMPHECTIRRRVRTKGALGGSSDSFTDEQTEVVCWEQAASDSEIREYEKKGMRIDCKVYFPTDPGVTSRHQILVTERSGVAVALPIALDVVSNAGPDASTGAGILFRVMCKRVTSSEN